MLDFFVIGMTLFRVLNDLIGKNVRANLCCMDLGAVRKEYVPYAIHLVVLIYGGSYT